MSELPESVIQGIKALNQGEYYAAHEFFEDAWRETPDSTREFYRSLLHISGGFYRLTEDRPDAAKKFFSRARHWLQFFSNNHMGLNVERIKSLLTQLIDDIESGKPCQEIIKVHAVKIVLERQDNSK